MNIVISKKPEGYENDLGEFKAQLFDGNCGEPIAWGFRILTRLGEEKWENLKQFGRLECSYPTWFLITKSLTREEAIKKYGKVTNEVYGPRGGWKSTTFGNKTFCSHKIEPD